MCVYLLNIRKALKSLPQNFLRTNYITFSRITIYISWLKTKPFENIYFLRTCNLL